MKIIESNEEFLNILKSEMSIIGPRPERPEFVTELSENYQRQVFQMVLLYVGIITKTQSVFSSLILQKIIENLRFYLQMNLVTPNYSLILFYQIIFGLMSVI